MEFKEFLEKYKNLFITTELMGLFHDIGKMSSSFVETATKQVKKEKDFERETDKSHTKKELFEEEFTKKINEFVDKLINNVDVKNILQKGKFVEIIINHHNPTNLAKLASNNLIADVIFMPGSDGIDSGFDKGQVSNKWIQSLEDFHIMNFAGKKQNLNWKQFDEKRKKLQHKIVKIIESDFNINYKYESIIETYTTYTQLALAETRIPANDVRLSDHCLSVGALSKTLFIKLLWDFIQERDKKELIPWYIFKSIANWQLLAIRWNFDKYVENLRRVSDLVGRQELLKSFKRKVNNLLQFDYAIANKVYEDDYSIIFLFPPFEIPFIKENAKFIFEKIANLFPSELKGESILEFYMYKKPDVNLLKISNFFDEEKLKETFELVYFENFASEVDKKIREKIARKGWKFSLCEVCKSNITSKFFDNEDKICIDCEKIREKANIRYAGYETSDLTQIVKSDKYKKLSIVYIKLPVDLWISGYLLRTILIKDIESVRNDLESIEKKLNPYFTQFLQFIEKNNIKTLKDYWEKRKEISNNLENKSEDWIEKIGLNKIGIRESVLKDKIKEISKEKKYTPFDVIAYMLEEIFIQDLNELNKYKNISSIISKFYEKYPSPSRIRRILSDCENFFEAIVKILEDKKKYYKKLILSSKELAIIIPSDFTKEFLLKINELYKDEFKYLFGRFPIFILVGLFRDKFPLYVITEAIKNIRKLKFKSIILKGMTNAKELNLNINIKNYVETLDIDELAHKLFLNYELEDGTIKNISKLKNNSNIKFFPSVVDFIIFDTPERRYETLLYKDNTFYQRFDNYIGKYINSFFIETNDIEKVYNIMDEFNKIETSKVYKYIEILDINYQKWKSPDDKKLQKFWSNFVNDTYEVFLSSSIKNQKIKEYIKEFSKDLRIFKVFDIWKYLREEENK